VEIVVVDSSPRHYLSDALAAAYGARYLREPNPGLSRARNAATRAATGEIVAYLDDDAFPAPDWLRFLVPHFDDPRVAAVTGTIRAPVSNSEAEPLWERLGGFRPSGGSPTSLDRDTPGWFRVAHFGGIGNGSNMAFRRSAFAQWRGFNEDLGRGHIVPGGEEHYAFYELVERGYRVVYAPRAVVYHPAPADAAELEQRYLASLHESGMYIAYVFGHLPHCRPELLKLFLTYVRNLLFRSRGMPSDLGRLGISRYRQVRTVAAGVLEYVRSARHKVS
jgi:cellulose synthase/poly-beta-1,6-N-acetylglucosamine synthase-like glycosyltransferase